ncbi:class I SAM-dependent methyltransferase [Aequorivita lipolytica]|uniref:Class I SAM-dependent methyltransferase n=1 Tax=Aequorivita lipolytica TaxID=153267 RepID=A0A5C6YM16_9FLAO|nr:class I SAM-dependent methyltransferase [Aequorivita lipolytica]TXD67974.1 class I SAM-dependent methyltransferase [Aequorivita lipolytica]SRX51506.1 dTDP-3-amino-3,4, 6-trideoxy-alpha-D-glucopyranose [Aequorivita lipolytica]
MQKEKNNWYASWFNTPYYHILYKDRNHREAALFMQTLTNFLKLNENDTILDLACGKGRHAKYLYKQGFNVTGVDLSEESIQYAKQYEKPGLHFEVHDMCLPYPKQFDAVFNLFTSFGYFENEVDNLRTIKSIKEELLPNGFGVIDFLNVELAIKNLVPSEKKKVGDIVFHIEKYVEDGYIIKNIRFTDEGTEYHYVEKVKALVLQDFKEYFEEAKIELKHAFGNYHLNDFDENTSERLILIFN